MSASSNVKVSRFLASRYLSFSTMLKLSVEHATQFAIQDIAFTPRALRDEDLRGLRPYRLALHKRVVNRWEELPAEIKIAYRSAIRRHRTKLVPQSVS